MPIRFVLFDHDGTLLSTLRLRTRALERAMQEIMGREVVVAITDGRLDFGTWERIFYGEFDGRRRKRVLIKIIGE